MPIYDQGYRRYEARAPLRAVRFWPITREALRLVLARRAFLVLMMAAWVPLVVQVVRIYVVTRFPEVGRILPVDGQLFGEFLGWERMFTWLVAIFAGSGLVANDLRTGGILVYLSRPLTRRDYVLGKLLVLVLLIFSITLVPGLLLYLVALALAPEQFLDWELAWIGPAVVVQSTLIALVLGLLVLAASALSRSARVAGVGFVGFLLALELAHNVLRQAFGRREAALLSIQGNLQAIGNALFGIADRYVSLPWTFSAAVLAAVSLLCLAVLRSRVRAVEVVR